MTAAPPPPSPTDRAPLAGLAAAGAALVYAVVSYWGFTTAAVDRLLIVAGAGWAGYTLWPGATTRVGVPRPVLGSALLVAAAVTFPLTWYLQFAVSGGRAVLLWWQWAAVSGMAAGVLLARGGWPPVRGLLFPPVFFAFALPLPTMILGPLQHRLQAFTTGVSHVLLRVVGLPAERPGDAFILRLPGGDLGVEEACSGVRSLTALTALAAFVAFRKGFGPARGVALVAVSVPIVALVNVVRVVLSGVIQEWIGAEYIRDSWHEALGLVMVLVGLGFICLAAAGLQKLGPTPPAAAAEVPPATPPRGRWFPVAATAVLAVTLIASVASGATGRASVPDQLPPPDLHLVPQTLGDWEGRDLPVSAHITDTLHQDAALYRVYRNRIGRTTFVWVLYWSTANQVLNYHHPDVCLPNAGLTPVSRSSEVLRPACGGEVPLTARVFTGDRGGLYALYWTQEGRRVWGEADELAAQKSIGVRGLVKGVSEVIRTGSANAGPGRLVVLIGTDDASEFGRGETLAFARALADEVYRVCPWAGPPEPPADTQPSPEPAPPR